MVLHLVSYPIPLGNTTIDKKLLYAPTFLLQSVDSQLSVGVQGMVYIQIFFQSLIFVQKIENLTDDIENFILDVVKDPLVLLPSAQYA